MQYRKMLALGAVAALGMMGNGAMAADPIKVGLIVPMTGPFASTGRQVEAGAKLYMQLHGDTVAGRKVELIVKDDTGLAPDLTKRIAQELVVKDKVDVLAGFGLTPLAFAAAPVSEEAKKPMIVMAAATSVITTKSPYIVRSSFTLPQAAVSMGEWAAKNGMKKVFTLVTDYAPGIDAETFFKKALVANGGEVAGEVRVPLKNPDYAPFLQRVKDAKPDALYVFMPSGEGAPFMNQFRARGLADAGIKLIGTGDVVDDDILNGMGDVALGTVTAHHYSAAHNSPENKAYVAAFEKANPNMRPNFMSVGGYDGMHLVYAAAAKGALEGDKFIAAVKGMAWTSPRGPVSIDPDTRDMIENIYIRRVEKVNGQLYNVEFSTIPSVKDPGKM